MDYKQVEKLLKSAVYAGHGVEGITLLTDDYAIKFWWSDDDMVTSYHVWTHYEDFPDFVKDNLVKLHYCSGLKPCTPITVFDRLAVADENIKPTSDIVRAIHWIADSYGYQADTLLDMPQLGYTTDGKLIILDIM